MKHLVSLHSPWLVSLVCCLLGMCWGCTDPSTTPTDTPPIAHHADSLALSSATDSITPPVAAIDSFRGNAYIIYQISPRHTDLRVFNPTDSGGVHTFASIADVARKAGKSLTFVANGGMFQADRSAQGLLIIDGHTLQPRDTATEGYGNFYLQPNGIFAVDAQGGGYVTTTQRFPDLADSVSIRYATQSGPMMVIDSVINPVFTDGSKNVHIRNAVGMTSTGMLVFAISTQPITFFDLASVMRRRGCHQALYLDGFVSRMYLPELGIGQLADGEGLGPLIAIFSDSLPQ